MDDIQFGDVQEAKPETHLRPDRNAHFAVVAYEQPNKNEIPVFLDFDVMLDMERHAASDKTVELGGVLLGGQFHDEEGQPFVLITDSLRAKHYESTKGSFKFTKEAWTEITKERNEYAEDLQMVGWYHTHPDWGVFLSGMDMFICDNFFNRPLDMAYVIDPCRGDRAFFQWSSDPRDRCKRQKGFYVIASRYRAVELEAAVASLQKDGFMPVENRLSGYAANGAPIINVTQPPASSQQNLPLWVMMTVQMCLLALLVWKLAVPSASTESEAELAKIAKQLEQIAQREDDARTNRAVVKVLDSVLNETQGLAPGTIERMTDLEARYEAAKQTEAIAVDHARRLDEDLKSQLASAESKEKELQRSLDDVIADRKVLREKAERLQTQLAALQPKEKKGSDKSAEEEPSYTYYWIGGLVLGLLALGGIAATLVYRPTNPEELTGERPASASDSEAGPMTIDGDDAAGKGA